MNFTLKENIATNSVLFSQRALDLVGNGAAYSTLLYQWDDTNSDSNK